MMRKYFFKDRFLAALSFNAESSHKEISEKCKCSITTAEKNLKELIDDSVVIRKRKYGMWFYRALTKKEVQNKKWRKENPETAREANRKSMKKWRDKYPEKARKNRMDWVRKNPEKQKASCDRWREKNRNHDLKKKKEWHLKNKEKKKEQEGLS